MKKGVTINFNLSNRAIYTLITLTLILIVSVGVYAFGTSNPSNFGHSAGEVDGLGTLATQNSISWSQITSGIPAGLSDGDDVGGHSNGGNCPAGQYARGVNANGVAEGCTTDAIGSSSPTLSQLPSGTTAGYGVYSSSFGSCQGIIAPLTGCTNTGSTCQSGYTGKKTGGGSSSSSPSPTYTCIKN